jgi:hypothetical protein
MYSACTFGGAAGANSAASSNGIDLGAAMVCQRYGLPVSGWIDGATTRYPSPPVLTSMPSNRPAH